MNYFIILLDIENREIYQVLVNKEQFQETNYVIHKNKLYLPAGENFSGSIMFFKESMSEVYVTNQKE